MPIITIDGKEIDARASDTIITAAAGAGIEIPHFCYHPELQYAGSCRMCMVEVEKSPKLLTACTTMVADGMVVRTGTPKVKKAREAVLEFLLLNHPLDCPICDKAGECPLQNNYFKYSAKDSRFSEIKWRKNKRVDLGPTIVHDQERCILCTRCVRFMDGYAKSPQLVVARRGSKNTLTTYPGAPLDSPYSLNTVDICPVGALTSKDFRFRCRTWFLKSAKSICPFCATGCGTIVQYKDDVIYRVLPAGPKDINGVFMCDQGRLGYAAINSAKRVKIPSFAESKNARRYMETTYEKAFAAVARNVKAAIGNKGAAAVAAVVSPYLSLEEAFLVLRWLSEAGHSNVALLDYTEGFDDFKCSDDILISKDKSPNRNGILEIMNRLSGSFVPFDSIAKGVAAARIESLLFFGPSGGCSPFFERHRETFEKCRFTASLTTHFENIAEVSDVAIPFLMWAESSGRFVNARGTIQKYSPVIKPANGEIMNNIEAIEGLLTTLGHKTHHSSPNSVFEQMIGKYKDIFSPRP